MSEETQGQASQESQPHQSFEPPYNQGNAYQPQGGGFGYGMQLALPNATVVLVLGILSIVTCCCFYGLIGIALAVVALILSKKDRQNYFANMGAYTESSYKNLNAGRTCAIIGLVLSAIIVLFCIVFGIAFGFKTLSDQEEMREILKQLQ